MNLSDQDLRILKLRFKYTYFNSNEIIHFLPNGLYILTLTPKFVESIKSISLLYNQIGYNLKEGDIIAKIDDINIYCPFNSSIIDINEQINLDLFKISITSSFLYILKPNLKTKIDLSNKFNMI